MISKEDRASRKAARERVSKRLERGKNVSVSDIVNETGVDERRAQIIINRGGLTKKELAKQDEPLQSPMIPSDSGEVMGPEKENKYGKKQIRYDMSEAGGGLSAKEVQKKMNNYQNNTDVKVGLGAQEFLNKKVKQMKSSDDARLGTNEGQEPPAAETPPASPSPQPEQTPAPQPTPSPEPNTAPNPRKTVVNNNNFANSGTFIGNNIQGNDYSVNIAGGASSNLQGTAQYMAMNDNAFAKSQAQLSGLGRASQQVEAANLQTNSAQDIANTDYLSRINPMYMGAKATQAQTQLYGDTFKFELPKFEMPVPGKKPEDKTKEIAAMYKN